LLGQAEDPRMIRLLDDTPRIVPLLRPAIDEHSQAAIGGDSPSQEGEVLRRPALGASISAARVQHHNLVARWQAESPPDLIGRLFIRRGGAKLQSWRFGRTAERFR